MKTKLEIAKERRTRREQDRADIIALTNEIKAFNKLINDKEDIDLTELKTQLTKLPELIAEPLNKSLGGFLDSFEPYLKMSQQKQKTPDLPGLLKNLKIEQPKLDLKPIAKEISKLKNKAQKQSQNPEDFLPYRRVVKMGTRFMFDDNMTSGGGGGGVDTSGLATTAKQDDIKNQLALKPGSDFDYIDAQQTSSSVDTYVYKTGGSGGTTVQTITVTYTSSAKTDIDKIEYA